MHKGAIMFSVHSLTQHSRNALNRSRTGKTRFNLFVQFLDGFEWVVGRGYFSHASSYCENVASAHRVVFWKTVLYFGKLICVLGNCSVLWETDLCFGKLIYV